MAEVTKGDRDAAWPIAEALGPYNFRDKKAFFRGVYDEGRLPQAFAIHRITVRKQVLEEAAKAIESMLDPIEATDYRVEQFIQAIRGLI